MCLKFLREFENLQEIFQNSWMLDESLLDSQKALIHAQIQLLSCSGCPPSCVL